MAKKTIEILDKFLIEAFAKNESLSIKIRNQTFVNGLKKGKTHYMAETFELGPNTIIPLKRK